jgi:tripartite-type tricarboxylate transporter receptor subunit TctC
MKTLRSVVLVALAGLLPLQALAQAYPSRAVRVLVGYPAGGANDLVARAFSARLAEALKQPFVVENRSGAAGTIAAEATAKAAPDGYTLFALSSAQVLAPHVRKSVTYDPVKDFRPIALAASSAYFLAVHPSVPAKNVAELVALAKAKPGGMSYASSGAGAGPHLTSSLFLAVAGIDIQHVPYRGDADALVDLIAGRVQTGFMSIAPTLPHLKAGALRALAVSSIERLPNLPDLPTVAESGYPGFDMGAWWGLVAPTGTPDAIVRQLIDAMKPIIEARAFGEQFAAQGLVAGKLVGEAFGKKIADDYVRLGDVVKRAGIKPE